MEIGDKVLELLNLKEVNDFIRLFQYLCGQEFSQINLQDKIFLQNICNKPKLDLDYEQLNTILLILNQPTVSEEFFKFFFEDEKIKDLEQLKRGVSKFRTYAMLCYGNFRFAYKDLARVESKKFKEITQRFTPERGNETKTSMENRPDKLIEIENIPKEETYFLGYLSGAQADKDFITYAAIYSLRTDLSTNETCMKIFPTERNLSKMITAIDKTKSAVEKLDEVQRLDLTETYERLTDIKEKIKTVREIGQKNTDTYLTWDYMDVYVATSMREKWEYMACWNFTREVFEYPNLKTLKLRYFDPTQSYVPNRIDKGLIEGLMLKRAKCTVYLVQETDTLGKDSELAATLAQGKTVIAFIPNIAKKEQEYKKKYKHYGLRFLAKRLTLLEAEEILKEPSLQDRLAEKFGVDYDKKLNTLCEKVQQYLDLRLFHSWESELQRKYRTENENDFDVLWDMFFEIEKFYLDKRADTLINKHPLAIQVDVKTGIANGVLVVRDELDCAKLLYGIFTNNLDFEIVHKDEEAVTILKEKISGSPFRVVTDYERLINSFWNFYLTQP